MSYSSGLTGIPAGTSVMIADTDVVHRVGYFTGSGGPGVTVGFSDVSALYPADTQLVMKIPAGQQLWCRVDDSLATGRSVAYIITKE